MRRTSLLALAGCLVALVVLVAPAAPASDTECSGGVLFVPTIPAGTYDNIIVPRAQTCVLIGVTVTGNVKALEDAKLFILNSMIRGNVQGDKAEVVQLFDSGVGGNVEIKEGDVTDPGMNDVALCNTTVERGNLQIMKMAGNIAVGKLGLGCLGNTIENGNIQVEENQITEDNLNIEGNRVAGNLQVFKNTNATASSNNVFFNTVAGVIQCYENTGIFTGGPNFGKADPWILHPTNPGPNQCFGTST